MKGFSPITYLFNSVVVLTVPADSPAKTMKELHEWGRKKQGGLTFGTPGLGSPSHLLGAKILMADKVPFEAVHYRGGNPMMADLVTGRVDFSWPTLNTSRALLAEGKLRALALDADKRWDRLPDVPTLDELGFGKEKVASWFALAGPAGMPPALVNRVRELFIQASKDPELQKRLAENGTPIAHQHAGGDGQGDGAGMGDHAAARQDAEPAVSHEPAAVPRRCGRQLPASARLKEARERLLGTADAGPASRSARQRRTCARSRTNASARSSRCRSASACRRRPTASSAAGAGGST